MAQSLVSRIGASPLWRAGLASAFILGLAGFAAGVIPQACRNGIVVCPANAPSAAPAEVVLPADTVAPAEAAIAEPTPEPPPAVESIETALLDREPASLTQNDLVAQTFAALDVGLVTTPTELTARKVRTVSIGPDGMPLLASAEPAAEASAPEPIAVAEAEIPQPPEDPVPQASAEEEPPSPVAYAPVRGGTATVGRQGANVRSLPQTRGSDVLFALASGDEITIVETQNGWVKIVDERSRSGWVWDELIRR